MNTHDNTADNTNPLDGFGDNVDNDAYGSSTDVTEKSNNSTPVENEDDGEGNHKPVAEGDDSEEEDFYWDGEKLDSPTSETDEGSAADSELVKKLRQTIKDQRTELREAKINTPAQQTAPPEQLTLPPKPKMEDEGIDYDPEIYQQKLEEWYQTEARVKAQQQESTKAHEELLKTFNERKADYKSRVASLKIRGYEDAEALVAGEVSQGVQTALIMHAEKPELVVLALARNPELLKQAKEINDPVKLGVLIGTVQAKARAMPKGKKNVSGAPAEPRGAGASTVRDLDAELEKARSSGDYTRVVELKRKRKAAAKK